MALGAVILGVLGLSPSLTWIPEVPLLAAFVLVPTAILAVTGALVGRIDGSVRAGWFAGAIAGAIGGCVGGLTFVAFGKPVVNIAIGLVAGVLGGGVVRAAGAWFSRRRAPG